jgi:hypothetical protein
MANRPNLRPPSVSLVCYLLIIGAALGLFSALNVLREPIVEKADQVMKIIMVAIPILSGVCGWMMLQGLRVARIAFLGIVVPLAASCLIFEINGYAIVRLLLLSVYSGLLLRPAANRYFGGGVSNARSRPDSTEESIPATRRQRYDY